MALIGLSDFYYAVVVNDSRTLAKTTYMTPTQVRGIMEVNINPNSSVNTLFAENGPYSVATGLGKLEVDLSMADLPITVSAELLGHYVQNGALIRRAGDIPPFVAFGWKALKDNGFYRYTWLLKGKCTIPENKNKTTSDNVEFNTPTIKANFVQRDSDSCWIVEIDEDAPDYTATVGQNWFTKVYDDLIKPINVVCSITQGATGVATTIAPTITFDQALSGARLGAQNYAIYKTSDGTSVPVTYSIDGTKKIVTLTPSPALTAATEYVLVIKGAAGGGRNTYIKFTTA